MPRNRDAVHKDALNSIPVIDAALANTRDALQEARESVCKEIDGCIENAKGVVKELHTSVDTAIVEKLADATEEAYNAYNTIDHAVTGQVFQAINAAQNAGVELPGVTTLGSNQTATRGATLVPIKGPQRPGTSGNPALDFDPSVGYCTTDRNILDEGLPDCPAKPTLPGEPTTPPSKHPLPPSGDPTAGKPPKKPIPIPPGGPIKPLPIPPGKPGEVCPQPIIIQQPPIKIPECPKLPDIPKCPDPPDITINIPPQTPTIIIQPPFIPGFPPPQPIVIPPQPIPPQPQPQPPYQTPPYIPPAQTPPGDENPIVVPPEPPIETPPMTEYPTCPQPIVPVFPPNEPDRPAVSIRSDINLDKPQKYNCGAADRLAALREECIEFGKYLTQYPDEPFDARIASNMLINFRRKFWGGYGELQKEYDEWIEAYLKTDAMTRMYTQWVGHLKTALGGMAELVIYLSATRSFLQCMQLSLVSLSNEGEYSGNSRESGETTLQGGIGLSIPFMSDKLTTGAGATQANKVSLDKGYHAQAGFKFNYTIAPWIGSLIGIVDGFVENAANANCLTPEQASQCYLRGGMSYACLSRIVELSGGDMTEWDSLVWASSERLNTTEVLASWRRGLLKDKERDELLRKLGWLSNDQASIAIALTDYVPGASDLIRFMVRDVADTATVEDFKLDAEFDLKWVGYAKQKGFAQGISDETAKMYWRAHWDLPGLRSVYDALHRFRDDGTYDGPDELKTTENEVSKILAYNDMLPAWRKRLVALSYSPLTRVDSQRAFQLGVIDKDRLYKAFRDIGYDDKNANTLVTFTQSKREAYLLALRASRYYRDGHITGDQLRKRLEKYKVTDDEFKELVFELELQSNAALARQCVSAMRTRYLHGQYSKSEAREELLRKNYTVEHADRLVENWECVRSARSRELTAEKLCKLASAGLIGQDDYQSRLLRLGYTKTDAALLADDCKLSAVSKESRQKRIDENAKKRAELEADRLAEKEANFETDLEEKAKAKELKRERSEALRRKRLRNAAFDLSMMTQVDIISATETIELAVSSTILQLGISRLEAEAIVINAVKHFKKSGQKDFMEYLYTYWEADSKLQGS